MKILVIGGMHGNEPLGIEVVKQLALRKFKNIDTILANKQAITKNTRFIKTDLNRTFPGKLGDSNYETNRAAEIVKLCKKYDVVFDFHNTHCPDNDCSFVGQTASKLLYSISDYFGLKRVIVADYECLNKYAPNCISVEISLSSPKMDSQWWVGQIIALSRQTAALSAKELELYRFVYRVTLEDRDRLKLDTLNLQAFCPLDKSIARKLGVRSPAYLIFIGDSYTPYNYGGLLNKLDKV